MLSFNWFTRTRTLAALVVGVMAAASTAAAVANDNVVLHSGATYTYDDNSSCSGSKRLDPVNFMWIGATANVESTFYRAQIVKLDLESPDVLPSFRGVSGGTQYTLGDGGECVRQGFSEGREFGPKLDNGKHKEKIHVRLFAVTRGSRKMVVGDAHREHKAQCYTGGTTAGAIQRKDSVYRRYNGANGFSAGARRIYRAYQAAGRTPSEFHTPGSYWAYQCLHPVPAGENLPAVHGLKYNEPVKWKGDVYAVSLPG